ncbi:MAG: hypothetical protein HXS42_11610 [Theionarchaea archaeon]|nr:hypothetical protein [Theionarchaea archaeon]
MNKVCALILFLLIPYLAVSQLEVTSFTFSPQEPQPGEQVTLIVRLANKSYDQDIEATCRLFLNDELYDVKVVPVSHRSSSGVTFEWIAYPGQHHFALYMSYYQENIEYSDTFHEYLTVQGAPEEYDYFSEAVTLFNSEKYLQAKVVFGQAQTVFEDRNDTDNAVLCEEYILKCEQYIEANQLYTQAEESFYQKDYVNAPIYYQQAKSLYAILGDGRAAECQARLDEIGEIQSQRKGEGYISYLFLLLPAGALVIAVWWLRRRKGGSELPDYVPEKELEKPQQRSREKPLFRDAGEPGIFRTLDTIESQLDTQSPDTFKSLVREFRKQEQKFVQEEHELEEAQQIKQSMVNLKDKIKEKGKRLQDIQRLKDLSRKCDALMDGPVGDLVDAYNHYARLQNEFDGIPSTGSPEEEELKEKLKEYYQFIQEKAKSEQSESQ